MSEVREPTPHEVALQAALADSGVPLYSGGFRYDVFHPVTGIFSRELMPIVTLWVQSEIPTAEEVERIRDAGRKAARERLGSTPEEGVYAQHAIMGMFYKMGENAWSFRRANWTEGPTWPDPRPLDQVLAGI